MTSLAPAVALLAALGLSAGPAPRTLPKRTLVVCAPGYPGDTLQAQPLMDDFAALVARAASRPAGSIGAVYFETEAAGLARLAAGDAALALAPLPFFLKHAASLGLDPRLQVVTASGSSETWSLVARRDRLASADGLAGWELTGPAGYAPAFVRGPALGRWGTIPPAARITFSPAVLSALRRSATGEKVAVLLDGEQSAALASLPFAGDLEVVARSEPLPAMLLCTVGRRLARAESDRLIEALLSIDRQPGSAERLAAIRIVRFAPVDRPSLDAARTGYASAPGT